MKTHITSLSAIALLCTASLCPLTANAQVPDPATAPFPDFGFMIPASQAQGTKVFTLSQNYPDPGKTQPPPAITSVSVKDLRENWKDWLMAVRAYCFEGNIHGGDVQNDFRVGEDANPKWFQMPWQHSGPNGREGYHGLTKEAPVKAGQLAATQTFATGGAWAVGFFNDLAASKIGEVWKDHSAPKIEAMGDGFPVGSVLFKLLFLSIPKPMAEQQVPFLTNGVWWDAYATYNFADNTNRETIQVALIQMDIMVRVKDAPSGWVLGNFQYNGQAGGKAWENLVPVGLMWGQDPKIRATPPAPFPLTKTPINPALRETIINDGPELPPTHLGWNGRLNGPLDNPMSSCFSCHSTAQYPVNVPASPLFDSLLAKNVPASGQEGNDVWMQWFRNIQCNTLFTIKNPPPNQPASKSTDFCLQLSESLQNFYAWKLGMDGLSASKYAPAGKNAPKPTVDKHDPPMVIRNL